MVKEEKTTNVPSNQPTLVPGSNNVPPLRSTPPPVVRVAVLPSATALSNSPLLIQDLTNVDPLTQVPLATPKPYRDKFHGNDRAPILDTDCWIVQKSVAQSMLANVHLSADIALARGYDFSMAQDCVNTLTYLLSFLGCDF